MGWWISEEVNFKESKALNACYTVGHATFKRERCLLNDVLLSTGSKC